MRYIYLGLLVVFFGYGGLLRFFAPRRIGQLPGFVSQKSQLNQANWDQANYQFGGWLLQSGVITLILMVLLELTPLKDTGWGAWLLLIPVGLIPLEVLQVRAELPDESGGR